VFMGKRQGSGSCIFGLPEVYVSHVGHVSADM